MNVNVLKCFRSLVTGQLVLSFLCGILVGSFVGYLYMESIATRDRNEHVERAIHTLKLSGARPFSVRDLMGDGWDKVCIQWPYASRNQFTEKTGVYVPWMAYKTLTRGGEYGIIFSEDGKANRIIHLRGHQSAWLWSFDERGTGCSNTKNPQFGFEIKDGEKYLMFMRR